jgi:leucyl/phenylalanyl-tRNA--protein transferase
MKICAQWNFPLVDCQLPNNHLMSLGASTLARSDFLNILQQEIKHPTPDWATLKNTVHLTYNDN